MEKLDSINFSVLINLIAQAHHNNKLHEVFTSKESFENYLLETGLPLLKQELVKSGAQEWVVESLVNPSHITAIRNSLLDIYDVIENTGIVWATNYGERILAELISEYLKTGRRDKDENVKKLLISYHSICVKVLDRKNGDIAKHPIFQDPEFLSRTVKYKKEYSTEDLKTLILLNRSATFEERKQRNLERVFDGSSLITYLLPIDQWFETPIAKNLSIFLKEYLWVNTKDGEVTKKKPILNAVIKNPSILFKPTSEITDIESYREFIVNLVLEQPKILTYTQMGDIDDFAHVDPTKLFDTSFLFDERIQKEIPKHDAFRNINNVYFALAHAPNHGICPISLISKSFESNMNPLDKRYSSVVLNSCLGPFCNKNGFDLLLPALKSVDPTNPDHVKKAYALSHSLMYLADRWDKTTGYNISQKAKDVFLTTFKSYCQKNQNLTFEEVQGYITSNDGFVFFKDEIIQAFAEVNFLKVAPECSEHFDENVQTPTLY